jgi:hypothetical protein
MFPHDAAPSIGIGNLAVSKNRRTVLILPPPRSNISHIGIAAIAGAVILNK